MFMIQNHQEKTQVGIFSVIEDQCCELTYGSSKEIVEHSRRSVNC